MKTIEGELKDIVQRAKAAKGPLYIVADVGASYTRLAVLTEFKRGGTVVFAKQRVGSVGELVAALTRLEEMLGPDCYPRVAGAGIDVPGPVADNAAVIANFRAETTEGRTLRIDALPKRIFPPTRTVIMNDLESAATGLVGLNSVGDLDVFSYLWGDQKVAGAPLRQLPRANVFIVAPGTGLGCALLHWDFRRERFSVLPLEFGHTNVPLIDDVDLLKAYEKELGFTPEFDDVCSGRGLEFAYRFVAKGEKLSAGAISSAARDGDARAKNAMATYYRFVMHFSSQMVMGFQPKLVVLCGDNFVENKFYFDDAANVAAMRQRLLQHSMERLGFMSRAGVVLQTQRSNLNLIGCVYGAVLEARKMQSKL